MADRRIKWGNGREEALKDYPYGYPGPYIGVVCACNQSDCNKCTAYHEAVWRRWEELYQGA